MIDDLIAVVFAQLKVVLGLVLDRKSLEPKNKVQEFLRDAQTVLTNLLSAFIYAVLLSLFFRQALYLSRVMIFDWARYHRYIPDKIMGFGALIVALIFVLSLRFILVATTFIRSYHVFAFIGGFATLILLVRSLPRLFAAASPFEEALRMIWTAISL